MTKSKKTLLILGTISLVIIRLLSGFLTWTWIYTAVHVELAKGRGIYPTPEDGMRAKMANGGTNVERVEIVRTGTNSFDGSNPHVWFVGAKAWAATRPDGEPVGERGYYSGGSFFLRVKDGWAHVPEGAFPEFIGLGMRLFRIYGCSQPKHTCGQP